MMNVVSSLCASETDGESLWTTIACRQGPWHGYLKKKKKNIRRNPPTPNTHIRMKYQVLCLLFPYLPACWQIPSESSNWIVCFHKDQHCCWAAFISQGNVMGSFLTWFPLFASPFLSKLPFSEISSSLSPSLSSLAYFICFPVCSSTETSYGWKYMPRVVLERNW